MRYPLYLAVTPYRFVELLSSLSGFFVSTYKRDDEVVLEGVTGVRGLVRFEYSDECFSLRGYLGWTRWGADICASGNYSFSVEPNWTGEVSQVLHELLSVRLPFFLESLPSRFMINEVDLVDAIDTVAVKDLVKGFVSTVSLGLVVLSNPSELFIGLFHRRRLEEGAVVKDGKVVRAEKVVVPEGKKVIVGAFGLAPSNLVAVKY